MKKLKSRIENIKTELWESIKHEGIVMKSIRNKRKVLERGKSEEGTEEQRTVLCVCVSERDEENRRRAQQREGERRREDDLWLSPVC